LKNYQFNITFQTLESASGDLTVEKIHSFFKKKFPDVSIEDVFSLDSDYDTGRTVSFYWLKISIFN
jgi:hypothetical protein